MYAVIYWLGDNEVYPYLTENGQMKLFEKISEADDCADLLEDQQKLGKDLSARVISIESAK